MFDILDADSGGLLNVDELISGLMSMRGHVTKGQSLLMPTFVPIACSVVDTKAFKWFLSWILGSGISGKQHYIAMSSASS